MPKKEKNLYSYFNCTNYRQYGKTGGICANETVQAPSSIWIYSATVPAFCTFGRKHRAEEIVTAEIAEQKYINLKFNLDERICDGFYYSGVI